MRIDINSKLILRELKIEDSKNFYELLNRNYYHFLEALNWMDKDDLTNQAEESLKLRISMKNELNNLPAWFAIVYENKLCGMIGYNEIDKDNELGEIGYFIDEQYSSKGIMTLALNTVIEYSFSQLKLNKIELYIYENNIASCRLAEKFNFKLEGKLREVLKTDNNYLNQNVYGLLNSEHIKQ